MATEIKVWQVESNQLVEMKETTMADGGRTEFQDLKAWIKSDPRILGQDMLIIGEEVGTRSGPLDFLGIDKSGNIVVIELKRDRIPRQALAQAIDYVSDVALWNFDKLSEITQGFSGIPLEEYIATNFEIDLEDLSVNQTQRILLVGTSIEEPLQRMIEWLSGNYGVSINAIIFKYIRTKGGEELVARTMIIPEEIARERSRPRGKFPSSDKPGNYKDDDLEDKLREYLSQDAAIPRHMRETVLPLCLKHEFVTREMIKEELVSRKEAEDSGSAGRMLSAISLDLIRVPRDFLRQVIRYDRVNDTKDNYRIEKRYKGMIERLLRSLSVL